MGGNKKPRTAATDKRARDESLNASTLDEFKAQLLILEGELFDIRASHSTVLEEVKILREENLELKDSLQAQKHINNIMQRNTNDLEQYTRRNNVRIFDIDDRNPKETAEETEEKVAQLCRNKLGYNLQPWEVEVAHRTGRFQADGNRPIIVRLVSRKTRSGILINRKKLKGTKVVIAEDITHENLRLFRQVRDLDCVSQAWARDGRIFAKSRKDKVMEVKLNTPVTEDLFSTSAPTPSTSAKAAPAASPKQASTGTAAVASPIVREPMDVEGAGLPQPKPQPQPQPQQQQPDVSQKDSSEKTADTPKSSTPVKPNEHKTYSQPKL